MLFSLQKICINLTRNRQIMITRLLQDGNDRLDYRNSTSAIFAPKRRIGACTVLYSRAKC